MSELEKRRSEFQNLECALYVALSFQKVVYTVSRRGFLFKEDILDFKWRTEVVRSSIEGLRSQES